MLLPYSTSSTRRSVFWTLLMVAVVATGLLIPLGFLPVHDAPISPFLVLSSSVIAMTLLCVWCCVYVRDEPGLVRIALIGGTVLFLLLTVAVLRAVFTAPTLITTKRMHVQADIR